MHCFVRDEDLLIYAHLCLPPFVCLSYSLCFKSICTLRGEWRPNGSLTQPFNTTHKMFSCFPSLAATHPPLPNVSKTVNLVFLPVKAPKMQEDLHTSCDLISSGQVQVKLALKTFIFPLNIGMLTSTQGRST